MIIYLPRHAVKSAYKAKCSLCSQVLVCHSKSSLYCVQYMRARYIFLIFYLYTKCVGNMPWHEMRSEALFLLSFQGRKPHISLFLAKLISQAFAKIFYCNKFSFCTLTHCTVLYTVQHILFMEKILEIIS